MSKIQPIVRTDLDIDQLSTADWLSVQSQLTVALLDEIDELAARVLVAEAGFERSKFPDPSDAFRTAERFIVAREYRRGRLKLTRS